MDLLKRFWDASLDELKRGYLFDEGRDSHICLVCGQAFQRGRIYPLDGLLYDARKAAELHIRQEHGSMFEHLIGMDKKYTGLTEHQQMLIRLFYHGHDDKEVLARLGGSPSTVRNHRFQFREKEKQAKILLAIMELLREGAPEQSRLVPFPQGAHPLDDRYAITEGEYAEVLHKCFAEGLDGPITHFPEQEKKRLILVKHISRRFAPGRTYTEKEVNGMLEPVGHDYATLRRYLIEYGFLERTADGSAYWVKPGISIDDAASAGKDSQQESALPQLSRPFEASTAAKSQPKGAGKTAASGDQTGDRTSGALEEVEKALPIQKEGADPMDKESRKQKKLAYKEQAPTIGVFQIRNKFNDKRFIGSSRNTEAVFNRNRFMLSQGVHENPELLKDWKEQGAENFAFEVLETLELEEEERQNRRAVEEVLQEMERHWKEKLQPYGDKGYNE
ncbi:DUF2087 domain-containing protein [Heliobacterium gestii]|uniref:DUF2087 domain-containing protein n=1 Tax=Heliomicrobium gestii TaxID=2699 RepID=A0A845LHN6_HELGE|nr:DUF2087 domain-containing protein [Heliomicrobium gestii]MBM7868315.1 hypothetical protein [Heliomicrobium gestii]MZP44530.1 DUF2087 domain-containing protein [Heliomicrobium gestii]